MARIPFFLLLCLAFCSNTNSQTKLNMLVIAIHNETGDIYTASVNFLFRMNSTLVINKRVRIGPLPDHPDCLLPSYYCEHERTMTDNTPRALTILDHPEQPKLMLCGSLFQGLCQIRLLDNLDVPIWIQPYNQSVGLTTNGAASLFFLRSRDGRDVLFSATDYTPDRRSELSPAFVSQKDLVQKDREYTFERRAHQGAIHFGDNVKRTVILTFPDGGFWFVLFVHDDGLKKHTRLARMCHSDPVLGSYTEIPLSCKMKDNDKITTPSNNQTVDVATVAYHGEAPSELAVGTATALYVTFVREGYSNCGFCMFLMAGIHLDMDSVRLNCLGRGNYARLLNPTTGEYSPCHSNPSKLNDDDFCQYEDNPYVSSGGPDTEGVFIEGLINVIPTALAVFHEVGQSWAFMGFEGIGIFKVGFLPTVTGTKLAASEIIDKVPSVVLDWKQQKGYFLIDNRVLRIWTDICHQFETCVLCSNKVQMNCSWCNGVCRSNKVCVKMNHTSNECPPTILKITPLKGLLMGETHLVIEGDDIAINEFDTTPFVTVAGIECDVIRWDLKTVECVTGAHPRFTTHGSSAPLSGPVEIKMRGTSATSAVNFTYVEPILYGIFPGKGPNSGGTNVTFFGENLNLGKTVKLNVEGRKCIPFRIKENSIGCTIGARAEPRYYEIIDIKIDKMIRHCHPILYPPIDVGVPVSKTFKYLPDPEIHNVHPRKKTVWKSRNITVNGLNLDVVLEPRMLVYVPSKRGGEIEMQEPCWLDPDSKGATMTCSSPNLIMRYRWVVVPEGTDELVTHIAFLMDGVKELRNFRQSHGNLSRFLYYEDPVVNQFDGIMEVNQVLEIKGKYLNLVYTANEVYVTIGSNISCKVSSLTSDKLLCVLPSEVMTDSSLLGQKLQVKVVTGTTPGYYPGYVVIRGIQTSNDWIIVVCVVPVIVLSLVAAAMWYYKKHGVKIFSAEKASRFKQVKRDLEFEPVASNPPPVERMDSIQPALDSPLVDGETVQLLQSENLIILREHLIIGNIVGQGQFGCVNEGELGLPGDELVKVAVKTIKYEYDLTEDNITEFLHEGLIMKNFHHEHVLSLIGVCFDNDIPMVVVPFMDNGNLRTYIRDNENVLTVADLMKFSSHIASGMVYLASKKFIHRDLAARNCVLDSMLSVKVADFGLSRNVCDKKYYRSDNRKRKLPYKWMAPECMHNLKFSEKTDVWSYAVVLWEILTRGVLPYPTVDSFDLLEYIKCGHRLPMPEYCSKELYDLMLQCWQYRSEERPSFRDLKTSIQRMWEESSEDTERGLRLTSALNTKYMSSSIHQSEAVHDDLTEVQELDTLVQA